MIMKDGGIYEGQFKQGKRQGFGRDIQPDGDSYIGLWVDNMRHG